MLRHVAAQCITRRMVYGVVLCCNTVVEPQEGRNKVVKTVTLDPELVEWVERNVEEGRFATFTDGVRKSLLFLREFYESFEQEHGYKPP